MSAEVTAPPAVYGKASPWYQRIGYSPLPLPQGKKSSPPGGFTGRGAPMATAAQVSQWARTHKLGNIALRLPPGVVGIDADLYDDETKAPAELRRAAWAELVERCGPLPDSPRFTGRPDDGASGIRLYRVPDEYEAAGILPAGSNGLSPGEVIQHHHRYIVAPPSVHPVTRQPYRSIGGDPLPVDELPDLPEPWRRALCPPPPAPPPAPARAGLTGSAVTNGHGDGLTPFDDFRQRVTWDELMADAGGQFHHEASGETCWTRPGKNPRDGVSATTGYGTADKLKLFTPNWPPFEDGGSYSKEAVYALLHHGGDMSAAAGQLRRDGFGGDARVYGTGIRTPADDAANTPPAAASSGFAALEDAARETDPRRRAEVAARAVQDLIAAGLDGPGRASARAFVLSSKLLPAAEFDRLAAAAARAAGGPGTAQTSRPANGQEKHRSQLRMAERLARDYGNALRYAHGLGWLVWDGQRWAPDRDRAAMRGVIKVVKDAVREASVQGDEALLGDISTSETAPGLRGILTIAESLRPLSVPAESLDIDPYLLNCANGTLDLRTMNLRPADPDDLITKVTGCGFDPDAAGPEFGAFIAQVLPGRAVRDFMQRVTGYALLGKVTEHVLPILTGTGCNGKTTLVELILKAFGDYGIAADPELLTEHPHGQHPTGQADLFGVRLAALEETDQGRKLAVSTVKRLTGGNKIRARKMQRDFFEFDPSHTVLMVTNHKPRVPGDDPALWRRISIIPFDVKVSEPDGSLPDRLALELPAVLAWAIAGYAAYQKGGLDAPDEVQARTAAYRVASDALGRWLDDRTVQQQFASTRSGLLYADWSAWCGKVGEEPGSEVSFADGMAMRGFTKVKSHGVMTYKGIGLVVYEDDSDSGSHRRGSD